VTLPRLLLGATALAAACAPATRTVGLGPVKPVPIRIIILQDSTARLALDSAARRGDRTAMARWLADDVIIVSGTDTVHGRDAAARLLSRPWPGTSEPLHFAAGNPEYCMDGAYESGSAYSIVAHGPTEKADTVRFRYGVLWKQVDSSRVAMRAVAVAPAPWTPPKLKGCVLATPVRFEGTRVRISVFTPATLARWNTAASVRDQFDSRGYVPTDQTGPTPWAVVGLRLRGWKGLSLEGLMTLGSQHDSITAFNSTTGSSIASTIRRSSLVGAILGYEWHRLRLSAGPIFFTDTWSIREQLLLDWDNPNGASLAGVTKPDTWTEHRTGLLLEAAYSFPIAPYLFVEARAQQWSVRSSQIHGAGLFPPVNVNTSGYYLAVATGVAF